VRAPTAPVAITGVSRSSSSSSKGEACWWRCSVGLFAEHCWHPSPP
jgi:hypothetical protein